MKFGTLKPYQTRIIHYDIGHLFCYDKLGLYVRSKTRISCSLIYSLSVGELPTISHWWWIFFLRIGDKQERCTFVRWHFPSWWWVLCSLPLHFNTYDQQTLSSNFRPNPRVNWRHLYQLTWNRTKDGTNGLQQNSFYFRVANSWNLLPKNVVEADNTDTFKARLDATWMNHPTKYTIDVLPQTTKEHDQFGEALWVWQLKIHDY